EGETAMEPIRCILVPTDFSDRAAAALPTARSLARDHGAGLVLLHVAPIEVVPDAAFVVPLDPESSRGPLEDLRRRLEGPGLKGAVEVVLREGSPADQILTVAREKGCDLIVMGSHGRSGLGRLILGSVAEEVMRKATCPVMVVKPRATG